VRIRTIKPEFWRDQTIQGLAERTQLVYIGLWCMADDCGRFQADVDTIRAEIAKKARPSDVAQAVHQLVECEKVMTYEVNGESYGVVVNWWHQKIDKPSGPEWPPPPDSIIEKIAVNKSAEPPAMQTRSTDEASPNVRRPFDDYSTNYR